MRQVQISRTVLLDAPRHACDFFEALVDRQPRHRRPAHIRQICARRGLCRHASLGVQNGGSASALPELCVTRRDADVDLSQLLSLPRSPPAINAVSGMRVLRQG
jgi:hypothetical protein